ncbi:hypothetical protein [Mesorhizobium shangrilense]|uniref:Glutathione S-transferase n=1 Tax=Mesorhizobium shangrilense TaxID=460060 RepID=A0ABV2DQS6_9HYPH
MATFLPFNNVGRLPLALRYPSVSRWYRQLDAHATPFNGLDAPELRPARSQAEPN